MCWFDVYSVCNIVECFAFELGHEFEKARSGLLFFAYGSWCAVLYVPIRNILVLLIAGVMGDNMVFSGLKCNLSVCDGEWF